MSRACAIVSRAGREASPVKDRQADRREDSPRILECSAKNAVIPDEELTAQILDGIGVTPAGEDLFDATVGLVGMIQTLRRTPEPDLPNDPAVKTWKVGCSASVPTAPARHDAHGNSAHSVSALAEGTSGIV
jgi:hypothetical protein